MRRLRNAVSQRPTAQGTSQRHKPMEEKDIRMREMRKRDEINDTEIQKKGVWRIRL